MIRSLSLGALLCMAAFSQAATLHFTLLTDPSVLNHYPGADDLVGTADDIVSAFQAGTGPSSPNSVGSFSFWTVRFFGSSNITPEFEGDVVRFQTGSMTNDVTLQSLSSATVVVTGGTLTGTQAFFGGGQSTTTLGELGGSAPDELTLDILGQQLNGVIDIQVSTPATGGFFQYFDQVFSATGAIVPSTLFGSTGNPYVDGVLTPLAQSHSATALLLIQFHIMLPPSSDGLNNAVVAGIFAATTTDALPVLPSPTPSPTQDLPTPTATPRSADLDGNGTVNAEDLILFLKQFSAPPLR